MTARTHDAAALVLLALYVLAVPTEQHTVGTALAAVLANQLGGIAPDIDQPTAPFWRNLPVGRYMGKIFGALVGGHRFFSHSLLGLAAFGLAGMLFLQFLHPVIPRIDIEFVWIAFMIGMLSHLLMDSLTKEGVPWLLPVPIKFGFPPIRRLRITTGSWVESFLVLPGLIAFTIWLCSAHYATLAGVIQNSLVR